MAEFAENDVRLFRDYVPVDLVKRAPAIAEGMRTAQGAESAFEPQVRSVVAARGTLRAFLLGTLARVATVVEVGGVDTVQLGADAQGISIYDRIANGEYQLALTQLRALPHLPSTIGTSTIALGLRRESMSFRFIPEGPPGSEPEDTQGTLPGYDGPDVSDTERRALLSFAALFVDGAERAFWLDGLSAECHVGLGDPDSALALYRQILAARALARPRRKFIALRAAHARLARADRGFRSARQLSPEQRQSVSSDYRAAIRLLARARVSPANPLADEVRAYARKQLAKLAANLNAVGFRDSFVPVQRFPLLEARALDHITQARSAAANAVAFRERANQLEDLEAELRTELATAEDNAQIASSRASIAADRVERVEIEAEIVGVEQQFLVAGTVLGGAGSLLGAASPTGGGPAAGVVGVTSALVGFAARSAELALQQRMAELDRQIATSEARIAGFEARIAERRRDFIDSRLSVTQGRRLNKDLYYTLARIYEDLARAHLDTAVLVAFLYERALAFFLGKPELREIRFDYAEEQDGIISAPDLLAADVAAVTDAMSDRSLPKRDTFADVISLREAFPIEFAAFLQTGDMDFVVSLYELDKRRPGSHQGRLLDASLEFRGSVPPNGFTGTLTHMGRFLVRDRASTLEPGTQRLIPALPELEEALARQERGETAVAAVGGVMACDLGPDTKELDGGEPSAGTGSSQTFTLELLEGYGPAGMWRLEVDPAVTRFLTDVLLHLGMDAFESDVFQLAPKVRQLVASYEEELAAGDQLDRILPVSLRQQFSDAFAALETGTGELTIAADDLPNGTSDQRVKCVVAQALDDEGQGVADVVLEIARADVSFDDRQTTRADGFGRDVSQPLIVLGPEDRFPVAGTWSLRLSDASRFAELGDLQLFVLYAFVQA